ncbi:MAG: type IV pilus assembly protein PilM [Armatimonadota bacterium]|nr:type IV pilus assembly protein PilM [Armatimonadota bacterium]
MSFDGKTRARTPHRIGLDIGTHSVKGVEVVERGSELIIRAAQVVPILSTSNPNEPPTPDAIVHAVRTMLTTGGFQSNKVILALPPEAVYMKWLHLEASSPTELDETARVAAVRGAPFDPDDVVVDYRVLLPRARRGRNVHFVMLVAASASTIDTMLDLADRAGLEPVAVDVGPVAAARSIEDTTRRGSPLWSGQPRAHCIVGARSTTISVIRGDELEFARTVPVGGNDFTARIAERLSIDWEEAEKIKLSRGTRLLENATLVIATAEGEVSVPCDNVVGRLAREIQRSLRFFSSQYAEGSYLGIIGSTVLAGGGALLRGLDRALMYQGVEINSIADPFAGFSVDARPGLQSIGDFAAQFITAVGLAIGSYCDDSSLVEDRAAAA